MEAHARSHVVRKRHRYVDVFSEEQREQEYKNGEICVVTTPQLCFFRLFKLVFIILEIMKTLRVV